MIRSVAAVVAVLLAFPPASAFADGATSVQVAMRRTRDVRETELYVRREQSLGLGPVSFVYGASITDREALWAGVGLSVSAGIAGGWLVDASVMPGLRDDGSGPDLGHPLEIRSSLGLSRRVGPGRIGVGIDHMSNAKLGQQNPGTDGLFLRYRFAR